MDDDLREVSLDTVSKSLEQIFHGINILGRSLLIDVRNRDTDQCFVHTSSGLIDVRITHNDSDEDDTICIELYYTIKDKMIVSYNIKEKDLSTVFSWLKL